MRAKRSKPIRKQLRWVGNSVGVLLPKNLLQDLKLSPGSLVRIEVEEGGRLVLRKEEEKTISRIKMVESKENKTSLTEERLSA